MGRKKFKCPDGEEEKTDESKESEEEVKMHPEEAQGRSAKAQSVHHGSKGEGDREETLEKMLASVYSLFPICFLHSFDMSDLRSVVSSFGVMALGAMLIGCTPRNEQSVSATPDVPVVQKEEVVMKKDPVQKTTVSKNSPRVIRVTSELWKFTPNVIRVKKGENVTVSLQGLSGLHGFAVQDLGINVPVAQGKTVDVKLPTNKSGTFGFRCSIPCGQGHADMRGTIVIEE